MTITAAEMAKLPRHTVKTSDHGKDASFEGVLLFDVLQRPGIPLGKEMRGKALSTYLLATGRDGYAVVYALAELEPAIQDSEILVADQRDGKPLSDTEGPLRIVVPHDKKPARSLRMLDRIDVVQLRK